MYIFSLPINYRVIRKNKTIIDINGKTKHKSEFTKNQSMLAMLKMIKVNKVKYRYILMDSWYITTESLKYIHKNLNNLFVSTLKSNRTFKFLSEDSKQFRKVSTGNFQPNEVYHKSLKQNCSMGKAKARTVETNIGHLFCSIYSYVKLEKLKMKTHIDLMSI